MIKENKKPRIKTSIIWPTTTYFTFNQLYELNKDTVEKKITLRVKLVNEEIEKKNVAIEIGTIAGEKGRPPKVYTLTPLTQTTLNKALQDGVTLVEKIDEKVEGRPVSAKSLTTRPLTVASV